MMRLKNIELYFTHQTGNRRIAKSVFCAGEAVDLHLGVPRQQRLVLQVQNLSGEVVYEKRVLVSETETPHRRPATEGLGLKPTLSIPTENLVSGPYTVYVALANLKVVAASLFFVTRPTVPARILYCYPSNTINAYSFTNQINCYSKSAQGELLLQDASFHRTQNGKNIGEFLPGLKWLASLGESVRHVSDREMEEAQSYEGIELIILGGHSEYWTRRARVAFDRAIEAGMRALVLSGNTMWWQVRTPVDDQNQRLEIYRHREADPLAISAPNEVTTLWNWLDYAAIDSIGADFNHGGYPIARKYPVQGYLNDFLYMSDGVSPLNELIAGRRFPLGYAVEFDGMPIKGIDGDRLIPDDDRLQAYCSNILGFMPGYRGGFTIGTAHYYQKTRSHGGVFQIGAISAFSHPIQESKDFVDLLTVSTLSLLEGNVEIFYPLQDRAKVFFPYTTPNPQLAPLIQSAIAQGGT
ncbi:MAG: N,N-dimethylformamidase beta subunit family domain-containing protein [Myxococcota bacterium]|nr:N,N-dimethylformamidase beta subunit family domain-containing protein [Myxococcota bacterium]